MSNAGEADPSDREMAALNCGGIEIPLIRLLDSPCLKQNSEANAIDSCETF